jgi:hypothetical protein
MTASSMIWLIRERWRSVSRSRSGIRAAASHPEAKTAYVANSAAACSTAVNAVNAAKAAVTVS